MGKFLDGLQNITNALANRRNATSNNIIEGNRLRKNAASEIYRNGLGNKIVSIKVNTAFKEGLLFENEAEEKYFNKKLKKHIKKAATWQLVHGRGIIVIIEPTKKLTDPLSTTVNKNTVRFETFDGESVSVTSANRDLMKDNFYKPDIYIVRGEQVHPSRVIDFTYITPPFNDIPLYEYGGISEFELIYNQLVNDGITERATTAILEKNSTAFYRVKGFKDAMRSKRDGDIVKYFGALEDMRSIYGAGIIDEEDGIEVINQSLTNLQDADQITLRRLSMVTSIPMSVLVGENVRGLNATGDNEMSTFYMMIENYQENYIIDSINDLMRRLGLNEVEFNHPEQMTPLERAEIESKYIQNALQLQAMGEDYSAYLKEKDIELGLDDFKLFGDEDYNED